MGSVIKVEGLSKRYRIGLKEKQADTLMGQLANVIKSPWQNLKRLRELSRFGIEDESVFWALKNINFEVQEGEVLGIIGKNGAGKSTLLKLLSQISEPTSGKIKIHGRVASLLEVGTGFHPELSGRENIYMNGTILGMTRKEIDSKLEEIIEFSGVEKFIDTPVKFYSSGMKVRLGFSVAAHLDPEILIIDEVLAVGDFEFQNKCLGKMEDVSKNQGRTVIFVSHNIQAVQSLCTRSIVLESGIIKFNGDTRQALNSYQTFELTERNEKLFWDFNDHPQKVEKGRGLMSGTILKGKEISDTFFTRDEFIAEFKFHDSKGLDNVVFGMVIKDQNGVSILGVNNFDLGLVLSRERVYSGTLIFTIPSLPIVGDSKYYIDLYFGENGDNYDRLYNAMSFKVKPTDIFKKGKVLNPNYNIVDPGNVKIKLLYD